MKNNEVRTTDVLFRLAAECKWDKACARCKSHPRDVGFTRNDGYTPLHVSLERKPPIEIVKMLLHVYPTAAKIAGTSVADMRHHNSYYQGDYTFFPIHTACAAGEPFEILKLLLIHNPDATRKRGGFYYQRKPIDYLWGYYFGMYICRSGTIGFEGSGWINRSAEYKRLYGHVSTVKSNKNFEHWLLLNEFWLQFCLILDVDNRGYRGAVSPVLKSNDDLLVLRAASALSSRDVECPDILRDVVLRLFGNILNGLKCSHYIEKQSKKKFLLHRAIKDGLPWQLIKNLCNVAPDLLSIQDCQSGLFPFMLAAVVAADVSDNVKGNDLEFVNMTFKLLLANPSLVMRSNGGV